MTIAYFPVMGAGEKTYAPIGPTDSTVGPYANFRPGTIVHGDGGASFVAASFTATASQVVNQGDLAFVDNNFVATLGVTSAAKLGVKVGTFFFGGNYQMAPTSAAFSFTFPSAGVYIVWVQVDGVSLLNCASTALTGKTVTSSTTAGQADAPTAGPASGSYTLGGVFLPATNYTFTANTTNGSAVLTNLSTVTGIYPNMTISGTGIPASTTISSINGSAGNYTITLSANATATGSTITMTCAKYVEAYLNSAFISAAN